MKFPKDEFAGLELPQISKSEWAAWGLISQEYCNPLAQKSMCPLANGRDCTSCLPKIKEAFQGARSANVPWMWVKKRLKFQRMEFEDEQETIVVNTNEWGEEEAGDDPFGSLLEDLAA